MIGGIGISCTTEFPGQVMNNESAVKQVGVVSTLKRFVQAKLYRHGGTDVSRSRVNHIAWTHLMSPSSMVS